jgi:hypothetical protein
MPVLKIGIALAVVILAIVFFSLSAGGITLFILRRKVPGRSLYAIKDDFARNSKSVFGSMFIQRAVIRCILWGMTVMICFSSVVLRFRQVWTRTLKKIGVH